MSKEKTIYVVTAGSYSDYHIEGIYSTKEKAEHAKKFFGVDDIRIEKYVLDALPEHPKNHFRYCVSMNSLGDVRQVKIENGDEVLNESEFACTEYIYSSTTGEYESTDNMVFYMWAKNTTHAIKIANERRGVLLANNWWGISHKEICSSMMDLFKDIMDKEIIVEKEPEEVVKETKRRIDFSLTKKGEIK